MACVICDNDKIEVGEKCLERQHQTICQCNEENVPTYCFDAPRKSNVTEKHTRQIKRKTIREYRALG